MTMTEVLDSYDRRRARAAGERPTLHTGDCRLTPERVRQEMMPVLSKVRSQARLILDTTYCNRK